MLNELLDNYLDADNPSKVSILFIVLLSASIIPVSIFIILVFLSAGFIDVFSIVPSNFMISGSIWFGILATFIFHKKTKGLNKETNSIDEKSIDTILTNTETDHDQD